MAKAKRKRRVLMWASLVGLTVTLAAAVASEFVTVSYREPTGSVPSRFVLHHSSVTVMYRIGGEDIDWLGHDVFRAGWSIVRAPLDRVWGRVWVPSCSRDKSSIFTLWHAQLPLWVPVVGFGVGAWLSRKGGWRGEGFCHRCGYDLRGTVSAVCPECGCGDQPAARKTA